MSNRLPPKLGAWLSLTRIANLPTVWSNLFVGTACGFVASVYHGSAEPIPTGGALLVQLAYHNAWLFGAATLFYLGGMSLNDITDRRFDRLERPDRPLVRGDVSIGSARLFAALCMLGGLATTVPYGPRAVTVALLLVGAIAAYNLTHKHFAGAVLFMGLCRALLYPLGAASFHNRFDPNLVWWTSIPVACLVGGYVMALTFIARRESAASLGKRRWLSLAMIPLVLLAGGLVWPSGWHWLWASIAAAGVIGWLSWCAWQVLAPRPNPKAAVLGWLAGLCLIDAFFLMLMTLPWLALLPALLFLLTRLLQRQLIGT